MKVGELCGRVQLTLLVLVLYPPCAAFADGIVIPTRAYSLPKIPDQQALIHYANGIETLVIRTSFVGQGTNFAWLVPLPSVPKIEPVSAGLFPTLQTIFQPAVVSSVTRYWLALPIAALLLWLGRAAIRFGLEKGVTCSFVEALLIGVNLVFAASILLPALSTARSRAAASGLSIAPVRVLNRQNAGLFDTVTLQSKSPSEFLRWLNQHGFATPTNIEPAVAGYVREGWVFAAARLIRQTNSNPVEATHPLAFTFAAAKPVYPLRLTAQGTHSCRIALYVFGPGRAQVPGFRVERCERPKYNVPHPYPRLQAGEIHIRHQELANLVRRAPVATKLTATLNSAAMAEDAYVDWRRFRPIGGKVYASGAARTFSGNVAAAVFAVLALGRWGWYRTKRGLPGRIYGGWPVTAAAAVAFLVFAVGLPKVPPESLRFTRLDTPTARGNVLELATLFLDELPDSEDLLPRRGGPRPSTPVSADVIWAALTRQDPGLKEARKFYGSALTNLFTGAEIRFEDSPGNVVLRAALPRNQSAERGNSATNNWDYELVWYDLDGAEAFSRPIPFSH